VNKTFKTNSQIIEIEATATEVINTKVVFWSHDKGTARLKFQLKKEGAIFPLTEGIIVPICLLFKSNSAADGVGRHIYNATIDDAVSGLISFILPDNILGYQGIVDGSIYIDMPNKQSLDTAGRFTFNIRRSPIDDMVPELEDYYYAGFNAVDQRIKDTLAKIETIETDFIKEMNAMQSKLNKFESDSKLQMDNIQQQITDKELYTKKETDDKFVPKTQTATATQAGIAKVIDSFASTDTLSALSALKGKQLNEKIDSRIRLISPKPAADIPSTYQEGISIGDGNTALGYPLDTCLIVTIKYNINRIVQYCYPKSYDGAFSAAQPQIRGAGTTQDTWSIWQKIILGKDVVHNVDSISETLPLSAGMGKFINDKANQRVDLTTNQTIGGIKNFTSMPKLNGVDLFEDTGWVNGTWGTDITSFNNDSSNLIRFRKIGNEVYFKGVATNTKVLPIGVQVLVKNIPAEFIPSDGLNVFFPVMQGSIKNTWHCALKATDKTLTLERYGTTSIIEVPANQWLPFSGSYPV
jgi:hypothetical protein